MKLLALAAEDSSEGEIALDWGLSAERPDVGSLLKKEYDEEEEEEGYEVVKPSEIDNDLSC